MTGNQRSRPGMTHRDTSRCLQCGDVGAGHRDAATLRALALARSGRELLGVAWGGLHALGARSTAEGVEIV
jgi:hypothetical protein